MATATWEETTTMSEFLPKLLDRVQALPAAGPLISRLPGAPAAYLVGGAVRDLLLGGEPFELDLVVEGDTAPLTASLDGEVRQHDRFGTATVVLDGFSYDIARSRRETYAHPGALPDVEPAPLSEDLRRRDFTVNAIAIALTGDRAGELTAAPDALEDLERRRLRVLHDGSFSDDPTRLFRLVRYASRLGFEIEPHTRALAEGAIAAGALDTVSGPRIGAELRLLAGEPDPVQALSALADLGLDAAVHPAFGLAGENETLARRALTLLPADARPDRLALSVAARRVPATDLSALLDALAFEAEDRDAILLAATSGGDLARALSVARAPSAIATSAAGAPPEVVALAGTAGAEQQARAWLDVLRHVRRSDRRARSARCGRPGGPADRARIACGAAAKLDGGATAASRNSRWLCSPPPGGPPEAGGRHARVASARVPNAPNVLRWKRQPRPLRGLRPDADRREVGSRRVGSLHDDRAARRRPRAALCVAVVRGDRSTHRSGAGARSQGDGSRSNASPPGPIRLNCASPTLCWRTIAWPARSRTWPGICAGRRPGGTTATSIRRCSAGPGGDRARAPGADLSIEGMVDFGGGGSRLPARAGDRRTSGARSTLARGRGSTATT